MLRPKFTPWKSFVDFESTKKNLTGNYFDRLESIISDLPKTPLEENDGYGVLIKSDVIWYLSGRPYYKVWPGIAEAMGNINIEIPADMFTMPYPAFTIMLSDELSDEFGKTFMIGYVPRSEVAKGRQDIGKWEDERDGRRFLFNIHVAHTNESGIFISSGTAYEGDSMQDLVDNANNAPVPDGFLDVSSGIRTKALSIAIAVSLFGTDQHEVVCPDIERRVIDRNCRPKVLKMREEDAEKKHARDVAKCKGWLVGSEIDLPRPVTINSGNHGDGDGHELTAGHIRSGHMRMQTCGKENKDRKLIFVPPTVVRPDLPFRQSHGYRIKG